ncbi:GGDEF domain-containing protein [Pleionea sediminis]|uniref:GGDEF domain-containing protein n=1 Tax=Pleionea sediminis TaxID=2569479 RepID=UPI001185C7A6|nr:GGDEF domain-containing protein [Pleionea sediminis]
MNHSPSCHYKETLRLAGCFDIETLNEEFKNILAKIFPQHVIEIELRKDSFYLKNTKKLEIIEQEDIGEGRFRIICQGTPIGFITAERPLEEQDECALLEMLNVYFNLVNHIALSRVDPLTGVRNRQAFTQDLQKLSKSSSVFGRRKFDYPQFLALLDIDNFKLINDQFGHLIGDEVLVIFGQKLQTVFRDQDSCYRYGGEEFAVILNHSEAFSIRSILERFRASIESSRFPRVNKVTVSIGYSIIPPGFIPSDLMDRADRALYYSKKNGRNQVNDFVELMTQGKIKEVKSSGIEFL